MKRRTKTKPETEPKIKNEVKIEPDTTPEAHPTAADSPSMCLTMCDVPEPEVSPGNGPEAESRAPTTKRVLPWNVNRETSREVTRQPIPLKEAPRQPTPPQETLRQPAVRQETSFSQTPVLRLDPRQVTVTTVVPAPPSAYIGVFRPNIPALNPADQAIYDAGYQKGHADAIAKDQSRLNIADTNGYNRGLAHA
jgi:hypothetical protein